MEVLEGIAGSEGMRPKGKERRAEAGLSSRLPGPRPPLPPPQLYIPERLLPRALSALQGEDLAQFKRKLCYFRASLRVSQARVEEAGVAELRDLLLCNYGWFDALQKAGEALARIGLQRQGQWLRSGTDGFCIPTWLEYALEGLDGDALEGFKRKLGHASPLSFPVSFSEVELKMIKNVPQLCSLMLTRCGWSGALSVGCEVLEAINWRQEAGWLRLAGRNRDPERFLRYGLQSLEREDLEKFKSSLGHFADQEESGSVFKGLVEEEKRKKFFGIQELVDAGEFSGNLIGRCGEVEALEKAADVLQAIGQKRQAGWLRLCMETCNPWKYLEDTLVGLGMEDLRELKRYLFPSHSWFPVSWRMVKAADVPELCRLLQKFCGDFFALHMAAEVLEAIGQEHQAHWVRSLMVGSGPKDWLDYVRLHLGQEKLEKFKAKLHDHQKGKGSDLVSLEFLDLLVQSDATELSRCLINFFGEDKALEVVTEVLDAMNENSEAEWVRMWTEEHHACRCLEDILSVLGEENLERFKLRVLDLSENKGFPPVPKAWMEESAIPQLIKMMFSFYGQGAALEMMGKALKGMAGRLSTSTRTDFCQHLMRISDSTAPQLESLVSSGEEMSGEAEKRAELGGNCVCNRCSSEKLPEKERPEVVYHPEAKQEMYKFQGSWNIDSKVTTRAQIIRSLKQNGINIKTVQFDKELCCTEPGSFRCCYTDLIFEVRGAVTITYQFDSWKKHRSTMDTQNLMIAGPLLDIQADPMEAVAAVHFPHFLCLADEDSSQLFIAHFAEEGMHLEKPTKVESFHAVLENPQFSPRGVVYRNHWLRRSVKFHAVVLLYQVPGNEGTKFHLYLLPNDSSIRQSVQDHEEMNRKIDKPPSTLRPLKIGNLFFVPALNDIVVYPKELEFHYMQTDMMQHYFELYDEKKQSRLELRLLEKEKDELVWEACVRQDDLNYAAFLAEQGNAKRSGPSNPTALERSRKQETSPLKQHFIHRHEVALIQRTANVNGILDILRQREILGSEDYQKIFSIKNDIDKMRELYSLMRSWNDYCKDQFYEALKIKDKFLIEDLEGK